MNHMNSLLERDETEVPSPQDTKLATEASRELLRAAEHDFKVRLDDGRELVLPKAARRLMIHILTEMSQGNAVTIIPIHAVLTTQEAADYINVSRPYLIGLLEKKEIPFSMVGTHRRVRFEDLERYRRDLEARRQEAMDELAAESQKLGMGY